MTMYERIPAQPIWRTRLPSFEKATDRLDEVVLLPMPPLP